MTTPESLPPLPEADVLIDDLAKWEAHVRRYDAEGDCNPLANTLQQARATLPQPAEGGEVVAWMWQHDETGRTGFVDAEQLAMGWEANNPRLKITAPLYTAPAPAVPGGWKLVPVEPTDAMVQAAHHIDLSYMPGQEGADRAAVYRAMLSASPAAPE